MKKKQKERSMAKEVSDEILATEIGNLLEESDATNQQVLSIGLALIVSVIAKLSSDKDKEKADVLDFSEKICDGLRRRLEDTIFKQPMTVMGEA